MEQLQLGLLLLHIDFTRFEYAKECSYILMETSKPRLTIPELNMVIKIFCAVFMFLYSISSAFGGVETAQFAKATFAAG
jgi:hypothetical protein